MEDELIEEVDATSQQHRSDEPSFEAFREAQQSYKGQVQHGKQGMARLTAANLVDKNDVPEEYTSTYTGLTDKYILFEAELIGANETVRVVCPARDEGINVRTALDWADANSIAELAGQHVPIRHVDSDVYRVEIFTRESGGPDLRDIPIRGLKFLNEHDLLQFKNGAWQLHWLVPMLSTLLLFGSVMTILLLAAMFSPLIMIGGFLSLLVGIGVYQSVFSR